VPGIVEKDQDAGERKGHRRKTTAFKVAELNRIDPRAREDKGAGVAGWWVLKWDAM
jgi:hypothetical protein